ncbi:zinc finger protein 358-like [Anopheles bellator]|uniref:zinc finger protein 358-like n=1 Tax=Anopheles bellator TaxID=139047 RepID=UPI002649D677|nr:zinc finger protein 358-like [Anopheles bellator]
MDWDIDIFNFDGFDEQELDLSIRSILLDEPATMLPVADQTLATAWPSELLTLPTDPSSPLQLQQIPLQLPDPYRKPSSCTSTVMDDLQDRDSDNDSGHASEVNQSFTDASLIEDDTLFGDSANDAGSDAENDVPPVAFDVEPGAVGDPEASPSSAPVCQVCGQQLAVSVTGRLPSSVRRCESCRKDFGVPPPPFGCPLCGKQLGSRLGLTCHLRVHTGERPFRCDVCERTFGLRSTLAAHQKLHGPEGALLCETCGRVFTQPSALSNHRHLHNPVRRHRCGLCGKEFVRLHALKTHIRSHSNERPYGCEQCGKTFTEKHVLVRHRKTHSGERPFACGVCGKTFKEKYDLLRHSLIHSGQRPHKCAVCSKSFVQSNALAKHRKCHERSGLAPVRLWRETVDGAGGDEGVPREVLVPREGLPCC